MKRFIAFIFAFSLLQCFAGGYDPYKVDPAYEKAVKPLLAVLDSAGAQGYAQMLSAFTALSQEYPREWRGYYWEAFANLRKAETEQGPQKEITLDEAERLINRAEMFIKENAELYLLRAWVLRERIAIDPANRESKYGADMNWYLSQAYAQDQSNPRYFFLKGKWSESDTTEAGKKITMRYYESANRLFADRPRNRNFSEPDWGRGETLVKLGLILPTEIIRENEMAEGAVKSDVDERGAEDVVIPEYMRGAVLPNSLLDENAGELILDSNYTEHKDSDFKLFNFKKNVKIDPAANKDEVPAKATEGSGRSDENKKDAPKKKATLGRIFSREKENEELPQGTDIKVEAPQKEVKKAKEKVEEKAEKQSSSDKKTKKKR